MGCVGASAQSSNGFFVGGSAVSVAIVYRKKCIGQLKRCRSIWTHGRPSATRRSTNPQRPVPAKCPRIPAAKSCTQLSRHHKLFRTSRQPILIPSEQRRGVVRSNGTFYTSCLAAPSCEPCFLTVRFICCLHCFDTTCEECISICVTLQGLFIGKS